MNRASDNPLSISVDCSCSEVLLVIQRSLDNMGLRALRTFDLQDARLGEAGCTCPYHGTSSCDCQMQVFMVYGEAAAPTTLMLYGHDRQTLISLMDSPSRPADGLVLRTIEEAIHRMRTQQGL